MSESVIAIPANTSISLLKWFYTDGSGGVQAAGNSKVTKILARYAE